jgi:hypothetical protein
LRGFISGVERCGRNHARGQGDVPTGGRITVLGGLTTASGGTLSGPAVFTISNGGKSIETS